MQACADIGVHIMKVVLKRDHVHMFLSIPIKLSLFDVILRFKCCSSRRNRWRPSFALALSGQVIPSLVIVFDSALANHIQLTRQHLGGSYISVANAHHYACKVAKVPPSL
jgi:hypothetical protein